MKLVQQLDTLWESIGEQVIKPIDGTLFTEDKVLGGPDVLWSAMATEPIKPQSYGPSNKHRLKAIEKSFDRIRASRKRGGLHRIAYVELDEIPTGVKMPNETLSVLFDEPESDLDIFLVNHKDIIPELAEAICLESNLLRSQTESNSSVILTGEKGGGKTAFINQLYSRYHYVFDNLNTIFIRLDIRSGDPVDYGILDTLEIQTFKILTRQYIDGGIDFKENEFFDQNDLDHYLSEKEIREEIFSTAKIIEWMSKNPTISAGSGKYKVDCSYYLDPSNPIDFRDFTSISNEDKIKVGAILREYAYQVGYDFVYVVDGLDESVIPLVKAQALSRWANEIDQIFKQQDCLRGFFIICARTRSFKHLSEYLDGDGRHNIPRWFVGSVSFKKLLAKRREYIFKRIERASKEDGIKKWSENSANFFLSLVDEAIKSVIKIPNKDGLLEEYFSKRGHIRALLRFRVNAIRVVGKLVEQYLEQMAEPVYRGFLLYELTTHLPGRELDSIKKYVLANSFRILAVDTYNYFDYFQEAIRFIKNKDPNTLYSPRNARDFPLIPLFWGDIPLVPSPCAMNNLLLLKIRILYLIYQQKTLPCVPVENIAETMQQILQYPKESVFVYIKAMILQRMLAYPNQSNPLTPFLRSCVELTEIGKQVIENWLTDFFIIEFTMQLSVVPQSVLKHFKRFPFPRGDNDFIHNTDSRMNTPEYLTILIKTISKFIGLVRMIERLESANCREFIYKIGKNEIEEEVLSRILAFSYDDSLVSNRLISAVQERVTKLIRKQYNITGRSIVRQENGAEAFSEESAGARKILIRLVEKFSVDIDGFLEKCLNQNI